MGLFTGIDLHSRRSFIGILDDNEKRLLSRDVPNELSVILEALRPYQRRIESIAVESTFNWYWLVDGLMDAGYEVHLAHPPALKPFSGLRFRNDESDAFYLARLLRFGILAEGYIFPKQLRPVRDMARARLKLIQDRSSNIHRFQGLVARELGASISGDLVKKLHESDIPDLFSHDDPPLADFQESLPPNQFLHETAKAYIGIIQYLTRRIRRLERHLKRRIQKTDDFRIITSIPGIGDILSYTILLESGPIPRFPSPGDYASYARMVPSEYLSAGKKKGKCHLHAGNPYLHWAFIEAAHCFKRYCLEAKEFFDQKNARVNEACATMSLGNKLARASYSMLKYRKEFDVNRMFRN